MAPSWCSDCDDTLGSLRGGVQNFVIRTTPASPSGPSINRNFCSSTTAEQRQVAEHHKWTHRRYRAPQRCIDRVLPMSMPYRAMHSNSWASITLRQRHLKPYAPTLGPLNRCTESDNGQSQHRVLPSVYCFKHALLLGVSHISVIHTRLSSDYKASFFNVPHWQSMWEICSHRPLSQHQQQQLKNTSWSVSKCTIRHTDSTVCGVLFQHSIVSCSFLREGFAHHPKVSQQVACLFRCP